MVIREIIKIDEEDVFEERVRTGKYNVSSVNDYGARLRQELGHPGLWGAHSITATHLPEDLREIGLVLQVSYRRCAMGRRIPGWPSSIHKIEEAEKAIFSSRFTVRNTDHGYQLFEALPARLPLSALPFNLPEKYQQDGLLVDVTFHKTWNFDRERYRSVNAFIEIISIMKTPEERAETRIVGGHGSHISDAPWQVLLFREEKDTPGDIRGCGGSIIAPNFILTAAHCVINMEPSTIRVYHRISNRRRIRDYEYFTVSRIIPYPNPGVDAALLELTSNIVPRNDPAIINFNARHNDFYRIGNRVHTTGWGQTETGEDVDRPYYLHGVDLTIICNDEATNALGHPVRFFEMAANGRADIQQGACHGDSGGPVTTLSRCNQRVLIGVTDGGSGICVGPSVFVRTSHLFEWISRYLAPADIPVQFQPPLPTPPPPLPPVTLSGPTLICSNATGAFTVQNNLPLNATVTWTSSPNLRHTGGGRFSVIHPSGVQASWVRATVNGVPSHRHYLWAGTPFVSDVRVTSTTHTGNSTIRRFTAFFPEIQRAMINPTGWRWELDAPSCCARFVGNTNRESVDIQFDGGGFFDLTVAATNACGVGTPHWAMIYYFGRSDGMRESTAARAQSRPISGAFHVLLGYEVDARMQRYDVRIYDSAGNMIKQVIAENGRAEFDLSDLPGGNYYLHICDGVDEPMIQPIVVENRS